MNLLALTITIPDWIFYWPFWCGFVCGIVFIIVLLMWWARDWSPFG